VVFETHALDVEENGVIEKYKIDGTQPYLTLTDPDGDCRQPNWSPRGDRIVYQSFQDGLWDLWVMDADGGRPRKVTDGSGDKTDASFSPDGEWIVYSYEAEEEDAAGIYVVPAAGGDPIRVTSPDGYDGAPAWSWDGNLIAFESAPSDPEESGGTSIWIIAVPQL
jgi:TolB protein